MADRPFSDHSHEEQLGIFQAYFDRDLESYFSSTIMCCAKCHDEFRTTWPGTVSHDVDLQLGYMTIGYFLENSRIQDVFSPEDIKDLSQYLTCPNCEEVLDGEFWIYEHPFSVPRAFLHALDEIAELAIRTPFLLLNHSFAQEVFQAIQDLGKAVHPQIIGEPIFRARWAEEAPLTALADYGPPPANLVVDGRYNHAGHPMLYVAMSEKTALAEAMPSKGRLYIGQMTLNKPLKVLDLRVKREADTDEEILIQCLARSALCAAPQSGEDWIKREYVFTRFIADCALHSGFDAIAYGSTKQGMESNLVLLAPNDFTTFATLISACSIQP